MSKRPLNFAVLKYMTTVDVACVDDVMAALEDEYSDWKMFKPSGILEVLMTGEKMICLLRIIMSIIKMAN